MLGLLSRSCNLNSFKQTTIRSQSAYLFSSKLIESPAEGKTMCRVLFTLLVALVVVAQCDDKPSHVGNWNVSANATAPPCIRVQAAISVIVTYDKIKGNSTEKANGVLHFSVIQSDDTLQVLFTCRLGQRRAATARPCISNGISSMTGHLQWSV